MELLEYSQYVGKKVYSLKNKSLSLVTGAYVDQIGEVHLIFNYIHQDASGQWGASSMSEKLSIIKSNTQFEIVD